VLYNTGARVSEVVNLKATDLRLDNAPQVKLLGKGRRHRTCPLWPETAEALRAYLQQRAPRAPGCQQLFLNATGAPLTRFGVRYILREYVSRAQCLCPSLTHKPVSPHTLRHTTAMHLLRAGNDVNMVSYWLGHADINTTHVYVEIDMEMKRKMLEKAPSPTVLTPRLWRQPALLQWLNRLTHTPGLCAANRAINPQNQAAVEKKPAQLHIIRGFT
jgi:integrase/recombinase XerD